MEGYHECSRHRGVAYACLKPARVNIVIALIIGALAGGLTGGLGLGETVKAFTDGLGGNATVAVSYAMLGAFVAALTKTGLPDAMVEASVKLIGNKEDSRKKHCLKF